MAARALKLDRTQALVAVGTLAGLAADTVTGPAMEGMARWCLRRQGSGNVSVEATAAEVENATRIATQAIAAGAGYDLLSAALAALPRREDRLEALRGVLYVCADEQSRGLEGTLVPLLGCLMGIQRDELDDVWSILPMTRVEAVAALATLVASVDNAVSLGELEVVMAWTTTLVADWAQSDEAEHALRVEVRSGYERALRAEGAAAQERLLEEIGEALPRHGDRLRGLEAAIQVVMEDRDLSGPEAQYIRDLAGRLGLQRDEAEELLGAHAQRVA